jgi:hypothetical protein
MEKAIAFGMKMPSSALSAIFCHGFVTGQGTCGGNAPPLADAYSGRNFRSKCLLQFAE